jgi:hypothetical protein
LYLHFSSLNVAFDLIITTKASLIPFCTDRPETALGIIHGAIPRPMGGSGPGFQQPGSATTID